MFASIGEPYLCEWRSGGLLVWWCLVLELNRDASLNKIKRNVPQSNVTGPNNGKVVTGGVFGPVFFFFFPPLFFFFWGKQYHNINNTGKKTSTHQVYVSLHYCVVIVTVLKKIHMLKNNTQTSVSWCVPSRLFRIQSAGLPCELHPGAYLHWSCLVLCEQTAV